MSALEWARVGEYSVVPGHPSEVGFPIGKPIADAVEIRALVPDDMAAVRRLHVMSQRALTSDYLSEEEIAVSVARFGTPEHTDMVLDAHPLAAWLDGHLVGTAGWTAMADRRITARIVHVHVDPLFVRLGIGQRLVQAAEASAREAGFQRFSARVTYNALAFFEGLGYARTSYGLQMLTRDCGLPVAHMRRSPAPEADIILPLQVPLVIMPELAPLPAAEPSLGGVLPELAVILHQS